MFGRLIMRRRDRRGFTLLEVLLVTAITAIALGVVTMAFRKLGDSNRLNIAVGTLTQYAAVARAYAMDNAVETMLVVNNLNGRMEIWHEQPNIAGGGWDPLSASAPNGYVYAPILDTSASMPLGSDGLPVVVVHPIDFNALVDNTGTRLRDTAASQENSDNLTWPAICFAPDGRLIQVLRRVSTRTPVDYQGNAIPPANINRRPDGTPIAGGLYPSFVDSTDSRITSTRGFIVSDRSKLEEIIAAGLPVNAPYYTPNELVTYWLTGARRFTDFVRYVVVNPWSGRELAAVQ